MSRSIEGIVSNPKICSGKPCVRGTRIPVHIILDLLAAGESFEGVRKAYPNITDEDITEQRLKEELNVLKKELYGLEKQ